MACQSHTRQQREGDGFTALVSHIPLGKFFRRVSTRRWEAFSGGDRFILSLQFYKRPSLFLNKFGIHVGSQEILSLLTRTYTQLNLLASTICLYKYVIKLTMHFQAPYICSSSEQGSPSLGTSTYYLLLLNGMT